MICAFHKVILAKKETNEPSTVIKHLETLWRFYAWCDSIDEDADFENIVLLYRRYAEELWHRLKIKKEISEGTAYASARMLADLIVRARKADEYGSGRSLLRQTRIRPPTDAKWLLGAEAEKKNPAAVNQFGRVLTSIARALDVESICGPLPIEITLEDGRRLLVQGGLKDVDTQWQRRRLDRARHQIRFADRRKKLADGVSPVDIPGRMSILNIKVDAELLIFIAQTGMPKFQAVMLRREEFRWKKNGEMFDAYRVFKGRRDGEAIFRCYGKYRNHLHDYFDWLDRSGLSSVSDRLFPYLHNGIVPAFDKARSFASIKGFLKRYDIPLFSTTDLRRHANNWLIRNNVSQSDVSLRGAHSERTNLRNYSKPSHQEAAVQLSRYFKEKDPSIVSPAGAPCEKEGGVPKPIPELERGSIEPDCVSAEGCLFCVNHRDVLSSDYCWKLASHAKLKSIELGMVKVITTDAEHPAETVIERINQKLDGISRSERAGAGWVATARDAIRAGRYHPFWAGSILLAELL